MDWLFESPRIRFRQVTDDDFGPLCEIVQDSEIMYAWGHIFHPHEVQEYWIDFIKKHYKQSGYCYYAAIERELDAFLGLMGPLKEYIDGRWRTGLGYILDKRYWHRGYAAEGVDACMQYAFSHLGADAVYAQIRPDNLPSRRVAEKLGMEVVGRYDRLYRGQVQPHLIYCRKRPDPAENPPVN